MKKEIVIRRSTQADLPEILGLYDQPDMDHGRTLPLEEARALYGSLAAFPDYAVYVADIDGEVVGVFSVIVLPTLCGLRDKIGLIEDVVVKADQQRLGIGRRMMEYAREYCREQGCYKVMLSSGTARESAHAFYRSLGFESYGLVFVCQLSE